MMHINLFLFGCGHHNAAWRHPNSPVERLGDIRYYEEMAQLAERGKLDAVFFADGHATNNITDGPRWFLEPVTMLTAISRATQHIGLVSTISSTFFTPFHAARLMASLDHISGGRAGWNVVTSMFDVEARNHGYEAMPGHAERYARADEFIQAVLQLWDSWDDGALLNDRAGDYVDENRVRQINHHGEHFLVDGPLTVPRPPQGNPVLFQAGASGHGRALAARYAEAIYAVAWDLPSAQAYYRDVKDRIRAAGRTVDVPILPGLVTFIGSTEAEARAKQRMLDELLPAETSLRQLQLFIDQDCMDWELDAPVPPLPPLEAFKGPKGRYATVLRIIETEQPTVRELLGRLAAGGGHCTMVGTPEQVADQMEHWYRNGGADGFNLMPPMQPESVQDFVDYVIPILQQRGLFRQDYEHTTLRGHLGLERPGRK
ncbi:FMN-dependent oxidoreductase, nitrilotriacetate monooxygenase family [Methylobacillus rhizosphaerae]|uniref:FMN-dependent oxidoreductase, nitrilotriacetate monooxygenase family n=1 Tax=Methylobacillus rhizosphaerae TaxID=551994 RepID=A0A238YF84_9PROT|nr:LLM class flavin-dependent oxidoreductase [Methylobacillus rhizosphaerae]SNR69253.1 FMN-dependent oxidoreductase, nitrilotriacetate monooxygenase family [Methylobacillus rhizosphaerae]